MNTEHDYDEEEDLQAQARFDLIAMRLHSRIAIIEAFASIPDQEWSGIEEETRFALRTTEGYVEGIASGFLAEVGRAVCKAVMGQIEATVSAEMVDARVEQIIAEHDEDMAVQRVAV